MSQKRLEFAAPNDHVVAKANDLVRARHSFSTVEQRIFVMMVAKLSRSDREFSAQTVRLRDVCQTEGKNASGLYDRAGEIADSLIDQTVEVQREAEDGRREFIKYNCFSLCRHKEGSGTIEAKFNEDMRPFLLRLKERFTLYLVTVFLRLRSKYSTQIYELLKMREDFGRKKMSVQAFRESLGLEDKYPRFSSLRRRVIDQAQGELEEKADIGFEYEVRRDGQSPVAVVFYIYQNEEVIQELREAIGEDESAEEYLGRRAGPESVSARRLFKSEVTEAASLEEEALREIEREARSRVGEPSGPRVQVEGKVARQMRQIYLNRGREEEG